jgi:hypothetical protein
VTRKELPMLVKTSKASIETALARAVDRNSTTCDFRSVTVKWSKDRHGCNIATVIGDFDGLRISVIVEEQDEGEWTVYLDGNLAGASWCSTTPRFESADEVDDVVSLLRRGRDLLSSVQVNVAFFAAR